MASGCPQGKPRLAASLQLQAHLLGTRLMARSGLSTRTVRMAERLTLCPSREYSIMLGEVEGQRVPGTPGAPSRPGTAPPTAVPGHDNEEVQPVPSVTQVALLAKQSQGDHLDGHLHREEGKDEVVEGLAGAGGRMGNWGLASPPPHPLPLSRALAHLQDAAALRAAVQVLTGPEHAQGHAVEQDDQHADMLEPRAGGLRVTPPMGPTLGPAQPRVTALSLDKAATRWR